MTQTLVRVTQLHIQNLLTWPAKKYVLVASVVARADPNFVVTSYLVNFVLFLKHFMYVSVPDLLMHVLSVL
jgi:hypothetical protein